MAEANSCKAKRILEWVESPEFARRAADLSKRIARGEEFSVPDLAAELDLPESFAFDAWEMAQERRLRREAH
jgi:hypothetical protein